MMTWLLEAFPVEDIADKTLADEHLKSLDSPFCLPGQERRRLLREKPAAPSAGISPSL